LVFSRTWEYNYKIFEWNKQSADFELVVGQTVLSHAPLSALFAYA